MSFSSTEKFMLGHITMNAAILITFDNIVYCFYS